MARGPLGSGSLGSLLDCNLARPDFLRLGQGEREHALIDLGRNLGGIDCRVEFEDATVIGPSAFAEEQFAGGGVGFAMTEDSDFIPFQGDLEALFGDAGHLGFEDVAVFGFEDIDFRCDEFLPPGMLRGWPDFCFYCGIHVLILSLI